MTTEPVGKPGDKLTEAEYDLIADHWHKLGLAVGWEDAEHWLREVAGTLFMANDRRAEFVRDLADEANKRATNLRKAHAIAKEAEDRSR